MFTHRLIPCLDIQNGRVVKGVNFVNLTDAGDPVNCATAYNNMGADELCFLDITASHEKRSILFEKVRETAMACFMPLTVGGGIRSLTDIRELLHNGADKISINTAAVKDPHFIQQAAQKFGSQCITVAIDAKKTHTHSNGTPRFEIFTHGGRQKTGIEAISFAQKMERLGAGEILLTSMDRDGTKEGFDLELTRAISENIRIPVIASGGAGTLQHLVDVIQIGKADAVLAASIFHFGTFTIAQAKRYMHNAGIPMRLVE